ncbi:MAG: hypothetical protein ACYCZX_16560 [Rhodospirillaceae bacterium]
MLCALLLFAPIAHAQESEQLSDPDADVSVAKPAFAKDTGPVVLIDEAHHNYHTAEARFKPLAGLLRNDGFKVSGSQAPFAAAVLARGKILVVANALNQVNVDHWQLPTPTAFTPQEITAVRTWVEGGGALLLIADHMPFAGAVSDFARAFGFTFINGFAFHLPPRPGDIFTRADGTLKADVITTGITSIMSFTGSAFLAPATAKPLMEFPKGYQVLMPKVAWEFSPATPTQDAAGALQGATMALGRGRLAVFGEAGMFTAQASNGNKFGFNSPDAPENKAFILNVVRWLAGVMK